jgi:hypothetical protein
MYKIESCLIKPSESGSSHLLYGYSAAFFKYESKMPVCVKRTGIPCFGPDSSVSKFTCSRLEPMVNLYVPVLEFVGKFSLYRCIKSNIARVISRPKHMAHMNSSTLKEHGFTEAAPLKTLTFSNLPYNKGSVFVIIDTTQAGKPTSDILYIGRTKKPTKRVFGGYIAGFGGKANRKINTKLFDDGYIEKAAICWTLSDKPKATQEELLEKFRKEHGEYPTWNSSSKKAQPKQVKPLTATKDAKPRTPRKPQT